MNATKASGTLVNRLSAWWGAWQFVVYLLALLAVSIGVNIWQWKRAMTAPLRAEIAGLDQALDDSTALQASTRERADTLVAAAETATATLQQAGKDYGRAMKNRPLSLQQCAPGTDRMTATNKALGQPTANE